MHYAVDECYTSKRVLRPASYRLPEELLARLDEEAAERQVSVTSLVTALLDEGLKTRRFPGVIYRDGPAGRRAALINGPDVWEVIASLRSTPGKGERRLRRLADELGQPIARLRTAIEFYAAFAEEIDERIEANERAAKRVRAEVRRRDELLAG